MIVIKKHSEHNKARDDIKFIIPNIFYHIHALGQEKILYTER